MYSSPQHIQDVVATIALESGAHVQKEVSHLFLCHIWQWMDILININNFHTLMDVVIIDPTCTNMVQWTSTITTHAIRKDMILHQTNTKRQFHSPCNWDIWVFSFSFYFIFITCAQTTIMCHHVFSLVPSMFVSRYR
jgi:hypothetical protein